MTMVSSGPISLGGTATTGGLNQSINVELGYSGTAQISLNDSAVRTLLGKASGAISLNDAYGKSNQFSFTISTNQTNANLATLATAAGWNGSSKLIATISSGVYISSNSTGTPALTVSGSFPGGVELTNGGIIVGMGGAGGKGRDGSGGAGSAGSAGGLALSVSSAITITNNGTIAGGGGGGGGGAGLNITYDAKAGYTSYMGGGGGGGGRSSNAANSAGGAGGAGGGTTSKPGGAGSAGTVSAAGTGGTRGQFDGANYGGAGGNGGDWGTAGASGANSSNNNGSQYSGGSAGGAVSGNSNITWAVTGTRLGGIT